DKGGRRGAPSRGAGHVRRGRRHGGWHAPGGDRAAARERGRNRGLRLRRRPRRRRQAVARRNQRPAPCPLVCERPPPMTHVDFRVRILPEDTEYLRKSPPEEFMYDAVDANLLMLVDGQSPFPSAGHRISPDGSLESVPILVF